MNATHVQDPKQRITMARVMKHPWVTKRMQWPLKSVREMMKEHGKVIDNEEPELPDLMATYNVLDVPRQVSTLPKPTSSTSPIPPLPSCFFHSPTPCAASLVPPLFTFWLTRLRYFVANAKYE